MVFVSDFDWVVEIVVGKFLTLGVAFDDSESDFMWWSLF